MSREGYARLCIEVDLSPRRRREIWVKIWFLEPVEGTPEAYRRKWEELDKVMEEPGWLAYSGKAEWNWEVKRAPLELVLPKGFYYVEVTGRGYTPAGFKVRLTGDVKVPITLDKMKGVDFDYWGTYYPEKGG